MSSIIKRMQNPLRRRILELLKENKAMSASELKRELKIATGTLYYHIDVLGDLLEREGKLFKLSKKGIKALGMTSSLITSELKVTSILHDKLVITTFSILGSIIMGIYSYLVVENGLTPLLCIALIEGKTTLQSVIIQLFMLVGLMYILSFIFTRWLTKEYLLAIPYLLFSLAAYPLYILFLKNISNSLLAIPMSIFVILNSIFLSKTIGMKIEKSLAINLTMAYVALFRSLFP